MSWAAFGGATLDFLKKVPGWLWLTLVGFAIGWAYVEQEKSRAVDRDRDRTKVKQAEVKAAVVERVTEIVSEERSSADAAIEARDHGPSFPHSDGVPDPLQRVIFRDT